MGQETTNQKQEPKTPTELEAMAGKLEDAYKQNAELRSEAARYRVERNNAMKQNKAYQTVIGKHNIGFVVEQADLSKMEIENGQVKGEFEYSPKGVSHETKQAHTPPVHTPPQELTHDYIKKMGTDWVNKNWKQVESFLMSQQ